MLPTGQGVLDRALKIAIENGNFPDEFQNLRFIQSRVGTRCPELNAILSWAQAAELTSDPNPSYDVTKAKPTEDVAVIILDDLGVNVDDARSWGQALAEAIEEVLETERGVEPA